MAIRPLPDPTLLRKLIEYQPATGAMFWLPRPPEMFAKGWRGRQHVCDVWNTKNAGNPAFNRPRGVTGVNLHIPRFGKPRWVARIQCGKMRIFLGSFHDFEAAVRARRQAEDQYGFGPVHGSSR